MTTTLPILDELKNSFTGTLYGKRAIIRLLNILAHLNCVALLPFEILTFKNHYN